MITSRSFGTNNSGNKVTLYTIDNGKARISVMNFGANLVKFEVKNRDGEYVDIVLGYDDAAGYDNDRGTYFGATVGRFANRIEGGKFTLNGVDYQLPINNNGKHCLHGGFNGFSFKMYDITLGDDSIACSILSPDGEEGFPGNMKFTVKYSLKDTSVEIEYFAESDKDTVCGFTNHSYFNLNGATSGTTMLNHTLQIDADGYCVVDEDALPTGFVSPVDGSPFDFRSPKLLGDVLGSDDLRLAPTAGGIDNNMILWNTQRELSHAATLYNPDNGIEIECLTDPPGIQIYTGQGLNMTGKGGKAYGAFAGIAMETQHYPDSPNHDNFPTTVLKAGDILKSETRYLFTVE